LRQRRRFTDPGLQFLSHNQPQSLINRSKSDCHVLNIRLSGISKDLYIALKQTVSDFENVYRKMIELVSIQCVTRKSLYENNLLLDEVA
jgi:hypothetical protein